jgi:hypothetical protein
VCVQRRGSSSLLPDPAHGGVKGRGEEVEGTGVEKERG